MKKKNHFAIEGIMRGVVIFLFSCVDLSVPINLCYLSFISDNLHVIYT